MKKIFWLLFSISVLFASNAVAEVYIVKSGDTLSGISKKHGVTVGAIQQSNPKIKNIHHIRVGWKVEIPSGTQTTVQTQTVSAPKFSGIIRAQLKKVWDGWVDPGANKYWKGKPTGSRFIQAMREGLQILAYSQENIQGILVEIAAGRHEEAYIYHASRGGYLVSEKDGARYRIVKMLGKDSRGRVEMITGPDGVSPSWKNENEAQPARLYKFGNAFYALPYICDNPTLVVLVPPTRKPPQLRVETPFVEPPSDSENPPEDPFTYIPPKENHWTLEHEPIVGAFFMGNKLGESKGGYGEYMAWLRKGECYVFENGWSPGAGIYGIYSGYDSKIGSYNGDENAWGPQAGIKYIGYGNNPWNFQLKGRFVWETMSGSTKEGYAFDQEGTKAGVYSELTKQIDEKWLMGIIGEVWWDISSSRTSTWSGDTPSERGMSSLDIFAQYQINEDWGARASAGIFTQEWDDLTGIHARLEARWKNTIMFGPYAVWYPFGLSDVYKGLSASDLTSYGAFVRVEFGEPIRKHYANKRMAKVKEADRAWLDNLLETKFANK